MNTIECFVIVVNLRACLFLMNKYNYDVVKLLLKGIFTFFLFHFTWSDFPRKVVDLIFGADCIIIVTIIVKQMFYIFQNLILKISFFFI